jgi:plasmid stabilization system protein ParE
VPINEVTLHDAAAEEYDAVFDWYLERSPDSALRFDAEVERAMLEIARAPPALGAGS